MKVADHYFEKENERKKQENEEEEGEYFQYQLWLNDMRNHFTLDQTLYHC